MIRYSANTGTQAAVSAGRTVRILVVYDNSPAAGAVAPDADDILNSDTINGLMDLGNTDRFMVLFDHYILWTETGSCGKLYKKFNLEQLYNVGGVDLTQGAIWLFTNHNNTAAGDIMAFQTRVRYTDV